jgi:hypothetical protein
VYNCTIIDACRLILKGHALPLETNMRPNQNHLGLKLCFFSCIGFFTTLWNPLAAEPGMPLWEHPFSSMVGAEAEALGQRAGSIYFHFHRVPDGHCHVSWYQLPSGQKLGETIAAANCKWNTDLTRSSQAAVVRPRFIPPSVVIGPSLDNSEVRNTMRLSADLRRFEIMPGIESNSFFRMAVNQDNSAYWYRVRADGTFIFDIEARSPNGELYWSTPLPSAVLNANSERFESIEHDQTGAVFWHERAARSGETRFRHALANCDGYTARRIASVLLIACDSDSVNHVYSAVDGSLLLAEPRSNLVYANGDIIIRREGEQLRATRSDGSALWTLDIESTASIQAYWADTIAVLESQRTRVIEVQSGTAIDLPTQIGTLDIDQDFVLWKLRSIPPQEKSAVYIADRRTGARTSFSPTRTTTANFPRQMRVNNDQVLLLEMPLGSSQDVFLPTTAALQVKLSLHATRGLHWERLFPTQNQGSFTPILIDSTSKILLETEQNDTESMFRVLNRSDGTTAFDFRFNRTGQKIVAAWFRPNQELVLITVSNQSSANAYQVFRYGIDGNLIASQTLPGVLYSQLPSAAFLGSERVSQVDVARIDEHVLVTIGNETHLQSVVDGARRWSRSGLYPSAIDLNQRRFIFANFQGEKFLADLATGVTTSSVPRNSEAHFASLIWSSDQGNVFLVSGSSLVWIGNDGSTRKIGLEGVRSILSIGRDRMTARAPLINAQGELCSAIRVMNSQLETINTELLSCGSPTFYSLPARATLATAVGDKLYVAYNQYSVLAQSPRWVGKRQLLPQSNVSIKQQLALESTEPTRSFGESEMQVRVDGTSNYTLGLTIYNDASESLPYEVLSCAPASAGACNGNTISVDGNQTLTLRLRYPLLASRAGLSILSGPVDRDYSDNSTFLLRAQEILRDGFE